MAYPQNASVAGAFGNIAESFTVGNTTKFRQMLEPKPAADPYRGGVRIIDLVATNSDASNARDVIIGEVLVLTTQGSGTGAITITTQNTITRATGSFVNEGYRIGQSIMIFAAAGLAAASSEGVIAQLTNVTALSLICNGTVLTNETLGAGCRITKFAQRCRVNVPANAGHTNAIPNVSLLGSSMDATKDFTGSEFTETGMLVIGMAANLSALPARIDIVGKYARR